jgi:hypothetical protein
MDMNEGGFEAYYWKIVRCICLEDGVGSLQVS